MLTPNDLPIEYSSITDVVRPQRDGTTLTQKRVVFFLGKFGPFTETFTPATWAADLRTRVGQLRTELIGIHS